MRLSLVPLIVCSLARADAPIAAPTDLPSLPLHALEATSWRGNSFFLTRGGPFVSVRETRANDEGWVTRHLAIATERGWFVEAFGDVLMSDSPRDHQLFGRMSARVVDGVLLVRASRAIWKRDYSQMLARDRDALPTYSCDELLVACVVDDGEPRCTEPLRVADRSACDEADTGEGSFAIAPRDWDWYLTAEPRSNDRLAFSPLGKRRPSSEHGFRVIVGEARFTGRSRGRAAAP